MNMNENPVYQIQFLLNKLQAYTTKINEIILKINIELNKISNPTINKYYNQLNDLTNNNINIYQNPMNLNLNTENKFLNRKISFTFIREVYTGTEKIYLSMDENSLLKELFNEYYKKIKRDDLVTNSDYTSFLFNLNNKTRLNGYINNQIKDLINEEKATIFVDEILED